MMCMYDSIQIRVSAQKTRPHLTAAALCEDLKRMNGDGFDNDKRIFDVRL